jgi:hypothetical protein
MSTRVKQIVSQVNLCNHSMFSTVLSKVLTGFQVSNLVASPASDNRRDIKNTFHSPPGGRRHLFGARLLEGLEPFRISWGPISWPYNGQALGKERGMLPANPARLRIQSLYRFQDRQPA